MEKQSLNQSLVKNNTLFLILLISIIIISFILFVPKISTTIIPQKSSDILRNFITDTHNRKDIDLQRYWELREFYSPGSFMYQPNGLPIPNLQLLTIARAHTEEFKPVLSFQSPLTQSLGGYTSTNRLKQNTSIVQNKILLHTSTLNLSSYPNNEYLLIFLKPIDGVKKANGFIPTTKSKEKMDYWLEITKITKSNKINP